MILIGLLHHRKDPVTVQKAYYLARAAQKLGAELVFFSPKRVNFETRQIRGYVLVDEQWIQVSRPFPQAIMNVGSPVKLEKSQDIVNKLKREIPFTSFPVGNKMVVYNRLQKSKLFVPYLIPSKNIYSVEEVINFINTYSKVVFKPIDGHQGENVSYIEKTPTGYIVELNKIKQMYTKDQFYILIAQKIKSHQYLVQPYINSRMKDGHSYDLRLHMVKNGEGKWAPPYVYGRVSPTDSILTNCHRGGLVLNFEEFLRVQYPYNTEEMKQKILTFGIDLSNHLDELQMKKHSEVFDELGIDIGIDEQNRIWLYEVNWRPGFSRRHYGKLGIEENLIAYAMYLAKKNIQS